MPSPKSVLRASSPEAGPGLTAVVLGAGVGGVLAAHVACRHFDSVVLVDADKLSRPSADGSLEAIVEAAKQRRGIPQLVQPHTLAMGGLQAMEALMPGFEAVLVGRGGVPLDLARDFHFYDFGGLYARADDSSLKSVGASRALIQATLQGELVRRNGGKLRVMDGCRASGLTWSEDKSCVTGVELADGRQLAADLVLAACGRSSGLPQWLKAAGHAVPDVVKADAQLTYVGRMCKMPADWDKKRWLGCICFGRPASMWGGAAIPVEGDIWQMIQWGYNGLVPPMDDAAFLEAAAQLPDRELYAAMLRAEPLTPLNKYGGAYNLQRAWDAVPPPPGVVAIGDCVQALNPASPRCCTVYAQGMSVAAKSAEALARCLEAAMPAEGGVDERREAARRLGPAFQRQLAAVIAPAWMMATAEDLRYPGTKKAGVAPPPRLMASYIDALCVASHHDVKVMSMFFEVAHLVRAPSFLFHPRMLLAGVWELLRGALAAAWPSSQSAGPAVKQE